MDKEEIKKEQEEWLTELINNHDELKNLPREAVGRLWASFSDDMAAGWLEDGGGMWEMFKNMYAEELKALKTASTPQPEHKSIEELKKEFDKKFVSSTERNALWLFRVNNDKSLSIALKEDVWNFFIPYIEPKNTGELEIEFRERYKYADCTQLLKNSIWNFFEPHLNSRNLLERLKGLKMKPKRISDHIAVTDRDRNSRGYNQAVYEINKKLDEFIESEKNE